MYRDSVNAIDEHDRAVGAILIGESLIAQCERAVDTFRNPHAADRWRAAREIHDDYPEIWRQLDRARTVLASRGANTAAYEEMRPNVKPALAVPSATQDTEIDIEALDDARRCGALRHTRSPCRRARSCRPRRACVRSAGYSSGQSRRRQDAPAPWRRGHPSACRPRAVTCS